MNYEELSNTQLENKQLEQFEQLEETLELSNNDQYNETIKFINECQLSIFDFTKNNANNIILKTKEKIIKKKYKLFQYNLTLKNYVRIDNFSTFSEISKYLEKQEIHTYQFKNIN
jgi:hypothetical protein